MPAVRFREHADGISVSSDYWDIEHERRSGGAWRALTFKNGSGKNLLRAPAASALRFLRADNARDAGPHGYFAESNETQPRLHAETTAHGVAVLAEGTYRAVDGAGAPIGYRRRTEYLDHGLVWTTLQVMSDVGCPGLVEARALELPLRAGLTDCYVRFHPTQAGGADLLGGRAWLDLTKQSGSTPFLTRFTPLQISCFERGVEGIEIFPGSELSEWDNAFKPDAGLGLYRIGHDSTGTTVELDPYCLAARRMRVRLQGCLTMKLGIVLPQSKPRAAAKRPAQHAFLDSNWLSDDQIEQLAQEGVGLAVFKDDYRDSGPFWRNGAVAPYDAAGAAQLRRTIEACQRNRIKIVAYASLRELHPETHAYEVNARSWMHTAARSLDLVHNWREKGESGALMCLRSGWLDYRKKTIDAILTALPWDGLCLDWPTPAPCCHTAHAAGAHHSDVDEVLDLLAYCRQRVGAEGTLALLAAADAAVMGVNIADHVIPRE